MSAGTLPSAWVLSVATYHLIASPRILTKLKAELKSAITDPDTVVPIEVLENLPYLVAVVKEALRLGDGVATRLQRVSPEKPMLFIDGYGSGKEYLIPPQIPVGMTGFHIHHDESIFPDAKSFIPERWIENPGLSRFLVSFSKGTRNCLGINLAYAEIYLCLAAIFRRFGSGGKDGVREEGDEGVLELFETGLKDVETAADFFVPVPVKGSEGIRIKVKVWQKPWLAVILPGLWFQSPDGGVEQVDVDHLCPQPSLGYIYRQNNRYGKGVAVDVAQFWLLKTFVVCALIMYI